MSYLFRLFGFVPEPADLEPLLRALIQADWDEVRRLAESNPVLLFTASKKKLVVESPHTWQLFDLQGITPLQLACQRRQHEIITEILLPQVNQYIASIQEAGKAEQVREETRKALASWKIYEMYQNEKGEEEIVIPREYKKMIQSLIDIFSTETFPRRVMRNQYDIDLKDRLNDEIEKALDSFREQILPKNFVKPDFLDPELLLLAAYKTYEENYFPPQYLEQRAQKCHFSVKVIGFIQSVLTPDIARNILKGLNSVMRGVIGASPDAYHLKLPGGQSFYRNSRDAVEGTGFEMFVALMGGFGGAAAKGDPMLSNSGILGDFLKHRQQVFIEMTTQYRLIHAHSAALS
jgi:hypothetical protein